MEFVLAAPWDGAGCLLRKDFEPAGFLQASHALATGESRLYASPTTALIERFLPQPKPPRVGLTTGSAELTTREREIASTGDLAGHGAAEGGGAGPVIPELLWRRSAWATRGLSNT